jgi:hypothetical protein
VRTAAHDRTDAEYRTIAKAIGFCLTLFENGSKFDDAESKKKLHEFVLNRIVFGEVQCVFLVAYKRLKRAAANAIGWTLADHIGERRFDDAVEVIKKVASFHPDLLRSKTACRIVYYAVAEKRVKHDGMAAVSTCIQHIMANFGEIRFPFTFFPVFSCLTRSPPADTDAIANSSGAGEIAKTIGLGLIARNEKLAAHPEFVRMVILSNAGALNSRAHLIDWLKILR